MLIVLLVQNLQLQDKDYNMEINNSEEFTTDELIAIERNIINKEARQYLSLTDWYIVRQTETGIEVSVEILDKRAEARASIDE